jgi:hypothetical protein
MITITAQKELVEILHDLDQVAEVRDAAGKLLAYITPANVREQELYEQAKRQIDPTVVESRLATGGKVYSFEQVMDHLKSLETAE